MSSENEALFERLFNLETSIVGSEIVTKFSVLYEALEDTQTSLGQFAMLAARHEWVGQLPGPMRVECEKNIALQYYEVAVSMKLTDPAELGII